ncbi:MAG TPA: hypothetical protein VKT52_00245 [Ktedonobacterales bacterium]|nr:hypothetical protein [Ktedonobacterales bacterium]
MIVVMRTGASEPEIEVVLEHLRERDLTPHISRGVQRTIIGVLGPVGPSGVAGALSGNITPELGPALEALDGVEQVVEVSKPYKLASSEFHPEPTVIRVASPGGDVLVGGREVVMMAGPCTV